MEITRTIIAVCLGLVVASQEKICGSPGQVDNGEIEYPSGNEFGAKLWLVQPRVILGWWGNVNSPVEIKAGWAGYLNVKFILVVGAILIVLIYLCRKSVSNYTHHHHHHHPNRWWFQYHCGSGWWHFSWLKRGVEGGQRTQNSALVLFYAGTRCVYLQGPIMEITRTIIAVCLGLVVASQEKTCGSPGQVDNGEIEYLPGNEFGDKLVVKCNLGFRLVGKRELTCGDQGWLGRLPVCEVVTCDPPAGIPNGLFSPVKDVYNYREVVQYSCTGDLILSGSKSVTCSEDGTFTPGPPQCTEVECADPKVANGEWASGSRPPHKYLDTVTYRCNAGYKMEGDASMECDLNGQWTPGIPKCTGK
ncbi:Complement decay-accelerating factor, GPI-anchored [Takifugu flavidus]|uniref:Complement decay-accelerating factor, GPI-anchored n=1 Tax=Takifugu flavidus TaxID=433684 RepID=A0A5C6MI26_9TELE|nr:Complement decay-accelerating factor, GPI-anchored [Takifugu flavidus]